jgi:phage shock protein C
MLCGVCAGVAEFFNIDPTIIRLVMVIITIVSWGTGIIAYIIAAIIIPNKVENNFDDNLKSANVNDSAKNEKDESNQSSHASKKTPNSEDEFNDYFKK